MFSNTANGAMCSTALDSIVATAQANGIDAEQYLTELFAHPTGTIILPLDIQSGSPRGEPDALLWDVDYLTVTFKTLYFSETMTFSIFALLLFQNYTTDMKKVQHSLDFSRN